MYTDRIFGTDRFCSLDHLLPLLPTDGGMKFFKMIPEFPLWFGRAALHRADLNWPLIGTCDCK